MRASRKLALVVVVLAAAGGYVAYANPFAEEAPEVTVTPVKVERGNLRLTVSSVGTITPPRAADLSFRGSGVVEEVYVQTGDEVKAGQPLAKLEIDTLQLAVSQADFAVQTAELNLRTLQEKARPEEIASAEASVAASTERLSTMEEQGLPEDVASAEANLLQAQSRLQDLQEPPPGDVASAQAAVESAQVNLINAQIRLEQLKNPTRADISAAEAAVASAQVNLNKLQTPSPADIASAQAMVQSAKSNLLNAQIKLDQLNNPTREQILSAENSVNNAKIGVSNAQSTMRDMRVKLTDEKRKQLVEGYIALYLARDRLATLRSGSGTEQEVVAAEIELIRTLKIVDILEAEVDYPEAGTTAYQLQSADASLQNAQNNLENALIAQEKLLTPPEADVAAAETSLLAAQASAESAETKLRQLLYPTPNDLATAQANLLTAQARHDQLVNPTPADIAAAEGSVQTAQANVLNAQTKLDRLLNPTQSDLASASSAVQQAAAALEKAKLPFRESDLASQRASLQQALANLSKVTTPGTELDIAKAQLTVAKLKLELNQAKLNLEHAVLKAPFDGIISNVDVTPGVRQGVGASTVVMSIIDPSVMQVELSVDEIDIAKVQRDQPVILTVDAIGPRPYRGKVVAIAPTATTQSGVTSYPVTISIQNPASLLAGMTASADIVYQQKQGVLLVHNRAIKTQGRERTVQVLVDGKPETRTITVGITDDQRTEVTEGLQEGNEVLIEGRPPATSGSTRIPGAGGFGGGGFRRGP